ncbi:MAG: hypothetical protein COS99_01375 [Candidatus Omnitrophica bacterium CG07_land_8_20_14_0_80_42_15]|uniref:Uncharacterized protein n=1 Tax=Candidatus Aquitaenariimonas noxiae TaxID=1974741 RepID=A0A2J0KUP0_9BACT|nr:MAG: hypothetical protein COS99_01375 [Candidatus Omnitrophica bacterium CG07_land_8_20_14_0_80_42_15]
MLCNIWNACLSELALKSSQPKQVRLKKKKTFKISLILENMLIFTFFSEFLLKNGYNALNNIRSNPQYAPQATNVHAAPCQSPQRIKVTIKAKTELQTPHFLIRKAIG